LLEPLAARLRAAGVNVTTQTRVGDAADAIASCARELQCDAIAMGTRGLGSIQSLLLGSTAQKSSISPTFRSS
jgi:nucleotide-binding universal stress UspA family protein